MVHRTQESSQSPTVPDLPQCSSAEMCGLLRRVVLAAASPPSVVRSPWCTCLESFTSTIFLHFPLAWERSSAGWAQLLCSIAVMAEKAGKRGFTANGGFFHTEKNDITGRNKK